MEITKDAQLIRRLDIDLMLRTVDYIKVYDDRLDFLFKSGIQIEIKG